MEEDKEIAFSEILDQSGNGYPTGESSPKDSPLTNKPLEKEKLDWRIKMIVGLLIILLIMGIGFSAYILNPVMSQEP
jgi:hypothetical protein